MVKDSSLPSFSIKTNTREEALSSSRSNRSLSDVESDDDNNSDESPFFHSNRSQWTTPPRFQKFDGSPSKYLLSTPSTGLTSPSTNASSNLEYLVGYSAKSTPDSSTSSSPIYSSPTRLFPQTSLVPSTPLVGSFSRALPRTEYITKTPTKLLGPSPLANSSLKLNGNLGATMVTESAVGNRLRVPLISLREGMRHKAVLNLDSITTLLLNLDGRDKVTKLLQYLCRFIVWWLAARSRQSSTDGIRVSIERFAGLKTSLTNSRKAYRLGRSLVEVQKLRALGLVQWLDRFLQQHCGEAVPTKSLIPSLYNVVYCLYHPLVPPTPRSASSTMPLWQIAGNACKNLGLLGFWAADNVSFLALSGFLDDFTKENRLLERTRLMSRASAVANRSYFVGAIAGLMVNWKSYWDHTKALRQQVHDAASNESSEDSQDELQKSQEKQFGLLVALLKSVCDVLVFSNNPGIDLWKRYRGRPMHEGFHCLCGIVSASAVLYANYPSTPNETMLKAKP